jgi:dihydroneopterin aldolase
MSTEVHLAFAHPDERGVATSDTLFDRISLRDHIVEVEIGAFQVERDITQRLSFNVSVEVLPIEGPIDDNVDRILSYDRVTEAIATELAAERLSLLETLAERIADRILLEPQVVRVLLRIEKLDRGPGALGVEIVRARAMTASAATRDPAPQPLFAHLTNDAIRSPHLSSWIDALAASGDPVVISVPLPRNYGLLAATPKSQRHIDLLAIEQNAWALCGLDPRCVVVSTFTELDWGMKNGQISVWAPSKIVLDSVDGNAVDIAQLDDWFGDLIKAKRRISIDADAPFDASQAI